MEEAKEMENNNEIILFTETNMNVRKECNQNSKEIKKKVKQYNKQVYEWFATKNIIRKIPRMMGVQLPRMNRFPFIFPENMQSLSNFIQSRSHRYERIRARNRVCKQKKFSFGFVITFLDLFLHTG